MIVVNFIIACNVVEYYNIFSGTFNEVLIILLNGLIELFDYFYCYKPLFMRVLFLFFNEWLDVQYGLCNYS